VGILLLLGSFLLGYGIDSNQNPEPVPNYELTPIEKCINEKREQFKLPSEYEKGIISLKFKDNVSKEQVKLTLSKYNLSIYQYKEEIDRYHVSVLAGSELQWICILEDEDLIDYGVINFLMRTFDNEG